MNKEQEAALIGPREMKPRGSREWCLQTIYLLKRRWERLEYTETEWRETLGELEDVRAWEVLGYTDEEAMLIAEIGRTRKQSIEDVKALNKHGVNQHSENRGFDIIKSSPSYDGGTSADYLTARIARDRPDILEEMRAGKYPSVRAAALEAGIVKARISIPSDPKSAALALCRKFTPDELQRIIEIIVERTAVDA